MAFADVISLIQVASSVLVVPLFSVIWGMNNRLVRLEEQIKHLQWQIDIATNGGAPQ